MGLLVVLPLAQSPASRFIETIIDMKVLVSVGIGSLVTWAVTKGYYIGAGEDLRKEAERLLRINNAMTRVMENSGLGKFVRDQQTGIATGGLIHDLKVGGGIHAHG